MATFKMILRLHDDVVSPVLFNTTTVCLGGVYTSIIMLHVFMSDQRDIVRLADWHAEGVSTPSRRVR